MAQTIQEKLIALVAKQLHSDASAITVGSTLESLGADSLDQVEIVMQIEEEFDIQMEDEKIENLKNLGQLIEYVQSLVQQS